MNTKSGNTLCELMSELIRAPKTRARVALWAILALAITAGGTASALTINLTYDSDATFLAAGLSPQDIIDMKLANTYAALQFTSNFTDPINVNIRVTAVSGTGTLGQSTTSLVTTTFAELTAKTIADATTADDATATGPGGSVPTVDPVVVSHNYLVSRAQAKALAITTDDLTQDGIYTFGGGFSYTYNPLDRAVAGKIDYIGVSMHEFSEIMGRIGIMGVDIGVGTPSYMQMDLFHYTGANTRGLNNGAGRFFSIDNGTTLLKAFNNAAVNGGDLQDWASGTNDSFNAFSSSGVQNDLTPVDLRVMDVIGYDRVTGPTPTPTAPPTLGNYPNTTVRLGANTTVTPDATPSNTTSINVSTSTNFKGLLEGNPANPAAGVVRVTDAHPAGTYTVTVTAFNSGPVTATSTFILTVTTPATCNPVTFSAAANFDVGTNPRAVAIGDFNGDGIQDLAFALTLDQVSIFLGTGTGSFGSAANFDVHDGPNSVAVGDFDGDGNQDLATVNSGSADVSVLLGNGDGTFTPATPRDIQVGPLPRTIKVGDFNNDQKQDLVVTNEFADNVSILIGNGNGTFSAANNFTVGSFPFGVAVGDFNGDGKQDLAVTRRAPASTVVVLLNTTTSVGGMVNFGAATPYDVGDDPFSVTVGSFNSNTDSLQDLATANHGSGNVSVLTNTGLGVFLQPAANFPAGSGPQTVEVGDFDGDGLQDLVVSNGDSDNVSILLGNGGGVFGAANDFGAGDLPDSIGVGDFNGDGMQDLAVPNYLSNNVSILLRQCPTPTPIPGPTPIIHVRATPARVREGGSANFVVEANRVLANPVTVNYLLSGNAILDRDYTLTPSPLPYQVTIPAGQVRTSVTLDANLDGMRERRGESATMTIQLGMDYAVYNGRHPPFKMATIKILD